MLWVSYLIAIWGLVCLALIFTHIKQIKKVDLLNTFLYSSLFLLLVISIQLHGGDGNSIMERAMSFAVFPLCIFLSIFKLKKEELIRVTWVSLIGCCLLAIKGPLMYLFVGLHFPYTSQHDFIYRYRTEFNANTEISPTYACIYFGFAIVLVLIQMKEFVKKRALLFIMMGVLLFNMILLSAKMPLMATAIVLFILFVRNQISIRTGWIRNVWVASSIVIVAIVGLLFLTRWGEFITGFRSDSSNAKENTLDVRRMITQCDLELGAKYFLTGVGPQHLQTKLNQCYYQFEGSALERNKFNTHNQYFDYLLSHGIIGLILLLLVMIVPLYKSIRNGDPVLMSFIILILLCMLTENILSRQGGIVFYAFFNALLLNRKIESVPKVLLAS